MRKAIPEIWSDQTSAIRQSSVLQKTRKTYKSPARMKTAPPTISRFHEITKTKSKMSAGILCMKSPAKVPQNPSFISKISKDINARKAMKIIERILGVQYVNFPTLRSIDQFASVLTNTPMKYGQSTIARIPFQNARCRNPIVNSQPANHENAEKL